MTLNEAVRRAVSWHPSIDEAIGRLNQRKEEIAVARSGYYPRVRGGIDSGYDSAGGSAWRPRLNVSASQMIYDFGKVSSSVAAETAGADISRAQLLLAVDSLIRDTAYAVIEVQRNRALRDVAAAQLAGVEAIAKLVRQRTDRGASTMSDEVQAEARVEAAQSTVLEINSQLERWQGNLASLIGAGGPVSPVAEVPAWLAKACANGEPDWPSVPQMMQAEAERKEAVALLDQSKAQIWPTLSLEAGTSYDLRQNADIRDSGSRPEFNVGLNLSGNLYEGGAAGARQAAADYALRAADAAGNAVRFEVGRALREASSQTGSLNQLLSSLSSRSEMMIRTRDLYRHQYIELGTRTLLDLLNAEQELHAAEFETVNTVHDLRRLNVDCVFNSGSARKSFALEEATVRGVSLKP
ncbi:MAG: TolC family protein [Shinella sp.]|nr:TolC family protein [Shinella sp.]